MDTKLVSVIKIEQKDGLKISHRKQKHFSKQLSLIDCSTKKEVAVMRWYETATITYCTVWIKISPYSTGSGKAGGGGYCKRSAAAAKALISAGVTLNQGIGARGMDLVEDALSAIARYLRVKKSMIVSANA